MQQPVPRVAFLCLGVMGAPMARHLFEAGLDVTVYNRTRATAEDWVAARRSEGDPSGRRSRAAATPAEAARDAEVVFACTGADPDLEAIVLGNDGALAAMSEGALFVDHTTASADMARRLGRAFASRRIDFLDAPVSGGQAGAESGQLTIMVGGEPTAYQRAAPLLDHFAKKHRLLGPVGSGQLTKMANQICIAGLLEALAEGMLFAKSVGLDGDPVIDVLSEGAAGSWQMSNRARTMLDGAFDFGFAVDWMRKDLSMALEEGLRRGLPLPVTELVDGRYAEVQRLGGGRLDTSSLMLALEEEHKRGPS